MESYNNMRPLYDADNCAFSLALAPVLVACSFEILVIDKVDMVEHRNMPIFLIYLHTHALGHLNYHVLRFAAANTKVALILLLYSFSSGTFILLSRFLCSLLSWMFVRLHETLGQL
ncbi:predicted protein [Lichtheimia corymbifera JMRC:FSU:9682]|uniref:Uncharacterized protein n=1 Tax=Lichtheimia corymbifera JMRC:FSU:9682 TaxID=1263082 RepID=A0A068S1Z1_9FUNG|nr:predicted protein [Lichtheimia corymbifera JMRC:FSU:9682]